LQAAVHRSPPLPARPSNETRKSIAKLSLALLHCRPH
jgi:hypothetical protein